MGYVWNKQQLFAKHH